MRRIEKHKKELAANYADYANGAHQELFFAPHSRNRRNSRLILFCVSQFFSCQQLQQRRRHRFRLFARHEVSHTRNHTPSHQRSERGPLGRW